MKNIHLIALACAALTAGCASPGEIANQSRQHCATMGYPTDDARFVECVERGFRGQAAQQQQIQSNVTTLLILEAFF